MDNIISITPNELKLIYEKFKKEVEYQSNYFNSHNKIASEVIIQVNENTFLSWNPKLDNNKVINF